MTVTAEETITIAGTGADSGASGLFSVTRRDKDAGTIAISAPAIDIKDGGQISANTSGAGRAGEIVIEAGSLSLTGGARIDSSSTRNASGGAGNVTIRGLGGQGMEAKIVRLTNSEVSTAAQSTGAGGAISIRATDIDLNNSKILARALGSGDAGNITLKATHAIELSDASSINTEAEKASGGNIRLSAPKRIELVDSEITSSVFGTSGTKAGNIDIDSQFLILNSSDMLARANEGQGGYIGIIAGYIIRSPDSDVNAKVALPVVTTLELPDLQKGLVELPVVFIDAASQVRASCEARRTGGESTFTEEGRGGLLPELGAEMPAFYTLGAGGKHAVDYLDGNRTAHRGLTAATTPFVGRSTVCIDFHR